MSPNKMWTFDNCGDTHWIASFNSGGDIRQLGPRVLIYLLNKNFEDPTASQPNGEGVIVTDSVVFEARVPVSEDFGAHFK
jgi:hypothetical protein